VRIPMASQFAPHGHFEVLHSSPEFPRTVVAGNSRAHSSVPSRDEGDDLGGDGAKKHCCLSGFEYWHNVAMGRIFALPDAVYNPESWFGTIFVCNGSVLPQVLVRVLAWVAWAYFVFILQQTYPENPELMVHSDAGPKVFSSLAIFFTIFRLSSAHGRYREGVLVYECTIDAIRSIIAKVISHMDKKGNRATKEEDLRAHNQSKLDMLRFSIVTGLLMKVQGRLSRVEDAEPRSRVNLIGLDVQRIRGLLYEDEFEALRKIARWDNWEKVPKSKMSLSDAFFSFLECEDSFSRCDKEQFPIYNWGLQHLRRHIGVTCFHKEMMAHGFVERMLNLFEANLETLQASGTGMLNAAIIPVPVAYVQMARLSLLMMLLVFPFQLAPADGLFSNIFFPSMVSLVFNCLDSICTHMEDPHGDDASDLKLATPLQDLECELMTQLEETSDPVFHAFVWKGLPPGDEWLLPREVTKYLCLWSECEAADALEVDVRSDAWLVG